MNKIKKTLISAFIVFNLLAMVRVHLPLENPLLQTLYRPIDSYLSFFSIYQSWTMFAPNPPRSNVFLTAEVEFMDGTKDTFKFPRASDMSLQEKYERGERFRVITDVIQNDNSSYLWPDTAKYVLRKLKETHFYKIPLKVHLVRHWNKIPDPEKKVVPHLSKNSEFYSYQFYTYEVL